MVIVVDWVKDLLPKSSQNDKFSCRTNFSELGCKVFGNLIGLADFGSIPGQRQTNTHSTKLHCEVVSESFAIFCVPNQAGYYL